MRQDKPSWTTKVRRFFMQFNMCKCPAGPTYVVREGILKCDICRKAAAWMDNPKYNTVSEKGEL